MYLIRWFPPSGAENILGVFTFREFCQLFWQGYTYERNQELDFQLENHFKLIPNNGEPFADSNRKDNHCYFNMNRHIFLNSKQIKIVANLKEDDECCEFILKHEGFKLDVTKIRNENSENEDMFYLRKISDRRPHLIHLQAKILEE
tara:strand:- start:1173 stop:1610 length:438 start_codon:yes stop_codon:yes gene_type:complete